MMTDTHPKSSRLRYSELATRLRTHADLIESMQEGDVLEGQPRVAFSSHWQEASLALYREAWEYRIRPRPLRRKMWAHLWENEDGEVRALHITDRSEAFFAADRTVPVTVIEGHDDG